MEVQAVIRRLLLGCLVATLLSLAGPGQAAMLTIEFDLAASTSAVAFNSVQNFTGPSSGSLTLTLTGVNLDGSLIGGPAEASLSGLSLTTSSTSSIQGVMDFSALSTDRLTQAGTARGVFDGMRIVFDAGQIMGQDDASTLCQGPLCALLSILDRPDFAFANVVPFTLLLEPGPSGTLMLRSETFFPLSVGGPQVGQPVIRIRGTETRRVAVPEPSQVGLFALTALALATARLRRSRPAAEPRLHDA